MKSGTGLTAKQRKAASQRAYEKHLMRAAIWHRERLDISEEEFRARWHEIAAKVARELDELFLRRAVAPSRAQ